MQQPPKRQQSSIQVNNPYNLSFKLITHTHLNILKRHLLFVIKQLPNISLVYNIREWNRVPV